MRTEAEIRERLTKAEQELKAARFKRQHTPVDDPHWVEFAKDEACWQSMVTTLRYVLGEIPGKEASDA